MTVEKVICKAMNMLGEYEKANEKIPYEMCKRQSVNKKWSPPAVGCYKINSDAAVFGDNTIGLGGIMRDHLGDVMATTCCLQHGCFEVDIAEALAARHCLTIALDAGLRDLVLETDCSKLYQYLQHGKCETSAFGVIVSDILLLASSCSSMDIAEALAARHCLTIALDAGLRDLVLETDCSKLYQYLQHGKCETSAFGVIVSDILLLASSCSSISFSQVGRDGNCAAHLLARGSIEFGEMRVWLEEVPHCASNVVL